MILSRRVGDPYGRAGDRYLLRRVGMYAIGVKIIVHYIEDFIISRFDSTKKQERQGKKYSQTSTNGYLPTMATLIFWPSRQSIH